LHICGYTIRLSQPKLPKVN